MKIPLVASSFIAAVTIVPVGAYALTRESVQEKVQDHCLSETASLEAWRLAEEKFKKNTDQESWVPQLKEIYVRIKETAGTESFKKACLDLYILDASSVFKSENKNLIDQVKTHCAITIEERLGESKKIEDSEIDSKVQSLSTPSKSQEEGALDKFLKKIYYSSDKKSEYKKECEILYKKQFLSETTNDWSFVEKYCKKGN